MTSGPTWRPGWYADPTGRYEFRYHNGTVWTGDVSVGGERFVDGAPFGPPTVPVAHGSPPRNGIATAALVCGIISIVVGWVPVVFVGGLVLALLAVSFGVTGLRRARPSGAGHGFALAGVITGAVGIAVAGVGLVVTVVLYRAVERYRDPAPHAVEIQRCQLDGGAVVVEGTLRNEGTDAADFTVVVAVDRAGSRTEIDRRRAELDDVAPGATARFSLTMSSTNGEVACRVVRVTGPLPFGVVPD